MKNPQINTQSMNVRNYQYLASGTPSFSNLGLKKLFSIHALHIWEISCITSESGGFEYKTS